jgi:site-specific DNA-methyltransferase (adenine-specific)
MQETGAHEPLSRRNLDQFFTPEWAAERLIERYFSDLGSHSRVIDAGCGRGSFLKAIPSVVPAIGIEIDPALAAFARDNTSRDVFVGDFQTLELPFTPSDVLGNPPFSRTVVEGFLARAAKELPEGGRVGFILPSYLFSFSSTVCRWQQLFSIRQEALPRDLFPRIRETLAFFMFRNEQVRRLWGFALFNEAAAVGMLPKTVRLVLKHGRMGERTWPAVVDQAMRDLGDEATLANLYEAIGPRKPRSIEFWQATVRRVVQEGPYEQLARGRWRRVRGVPSGRHNTSLAACSA